MSHKYGEIFWGRVSMEKAFKYFCIFMSCIIVLSSTIMGISVATKKESDEDVLGCNEIVNNIKNYELNMTSIIYAKNAKGEWEEYHRIHGDENRIWIDIEKVPQTLIDAFISIEDQRFYSHNGVDWKRTGGAFINYLPYVELYSSNQGGSTLTQQLIKNITADKDDSATRKLREIARALIIEKMIDKTTILEAYLNTISLGSGICGVQVAANYYFNKDVGELTLAECASLAAITKNPSAYNPSTKPEGNKKRRDDVLYKMYELEKITEEQYLDALKQEVVVDKSQQNDFEIPINNYFVDALINEVIEDFTVAYGCTANTASAMLYNGGYKIYATIDADIQDTMEAVYLNQAKYFPQKAKKDKSVFVQSAMTIMDYNGQIKGVVGGVGEKTVNRGLNRATDSPRQPGSTMKPLGVYVQAIENGDVNFSTVIEDKPLEHYFSDGRPGPTEWYGDYAGDMTVAKALERSANTIPCWILRDYVGIENSYKFLTEKFQFKHLTDIDKNLSSLALGGCQYGITTTESAAAYAVFGNGGKFYEPTTYTRVIDKDGIVVLYAEGGKQIIKQTTATIMNRLLQNVVYGGEGTGGAISSYSRMKAYAKTGTSTESKDLWMVAGTPYYVGSVWYGFDNPENIWNQGAAARVWRDVMKEIHEDLEVKEFELSEQVISARFCQATGQLASADCENIGIGYYQPDFEIGYCSGVHPVKDGESSSSEEIPSESIPSDPSSKDESSSSEESSSQESESDPDNESEGESSEGESSSEDSSTESPGDSSDSSSSDTSTSVDDTTTEQTNTG